MKKMKTIASIYYGYFLIKARCRGITPLFVSRVETETPFKGLNAVKTLQRCYNDAYYEAFILPVELEAHDRMVEEYLAQPPDK